MESFNLQRNCPVLYLYLSQTHVEVFRNRYGNNIYVCTYRLYVRVKNWLLAMHGVI